MVRPRTGLMMFEYFTYLDSETTSTTVAVTSQVCAAEWYVYIIKYDIVDLTFEAFTSFSNLIIRCEFEKQCRVTRVVHLWRGGNKLHWISKVQDEVVWKFKVIRQTITSITLINNDVFLNVQKENGKLKFVFLFLFLQLVVLLYLDLGT